MPPEITGLYGKKPRQPIGKDYVDSLTDEQKAELASKPLGAQLSETLMGSGWRESDGDIFDDIGGWIDDELMGGKELDYAKEQQRKHESAWDELIAGIPGADQFDFTAEQLDRAGAIPVNRIAFQEADAFTAGPSAAGTAQADPDAIAAQRRVLGELEGISSQGGLTAIDRARIAETQRDQEQFLRSQREADLANLESRGMAGSGVELIMGMGAGQEAAQRRAMDDLQTNAMAQQRAMDALMAQGDIGTTMRGQSFSEGFQRGSAIDAIEQFNAGQKQQGSQFNAAQRQGAMTSNADAANRAMLERAGMQQERDIYNADRRTGSRDARNQNVWDRYGAKERGVAGKTGQYQGDVQSALGRSGPSKLIGDITSFWGESRK